MSTEDARLDQMLDEDGVLVLSGEIDSYTTSDLAARLAGDPPVDAIDLAGITFIDSSGLRTLIEADRSRREAGRALAIRRPSTAVQRLFEISGLAGHFDVTT